MPLAVQHQLGAHAEGFATLGALGLVVRVVVLVHIEVEHACEVLATQLTVVGLLAHVHALVLNEVRAVTEAAATLVAWKGPFNCASAGAPTGQSSDQSPCSTWHRCAAAHPGGCACVELSLKQHTVTEYVGFLPGVCVLQVHQHGTL